MERQHNIKLIINECLNGNTAAERKLFDLYYGYLRSICQRYDQRHEVIEEMINDTFYNAFKYLNRFDSSYDFKPWLRKVCINSCLKYLKKYPVSLHIHLYDDLPVNEKEIDVSLEGSQYLKILNSLPQQYRTVFNLFVFEEYKHTEIAEKLGISVGTSKSNLSRAKVKLINAISVLRNSKSKNDKVNG